MNLLSVFKDLAGDQLADLAGNVTGTSKSEASSIMDSVLPALLGGVLGKVTDEKSAGGLLDFLGNNNLNGGLLDNIGDLFGSPEKQSNVMGMGGTILNFLLGDKTNAMIDVLTRVTGMNNTKVGSMVKIAAPLLLSFIGKKVKSENLSASGLFSLLSSQKEHVAAAVPAGLLSSLGMGNLGSQMGNVASQVGDQTGKAANAIGGTASNAANVVGGTANSVVDAGKGGISKLLPWIVLVLGALGLLWALKTCNSGDLTDAANSAMDKTEQMANEAGEAVGDAAEATGDAVMDAADATGDAMKDAGNAVAGAFKSFKLPNGSEIKSKSGSFINEMNDYLSGSETDETRRFSFDGVNFQTGSAALTVASNAQLNNLVALMKAYKTSAIRVEGHTDNTGDAGANLNLSKQRALAVKKYLMDNGIAAARIAADGLGQTKPVGPNTTDEGRAQNRRVDVYVTKK